jgi:hypothetical protein
VTDSAEFAALQADDEDLGDLLLKALPSKVSKMYNRASSEVLILEAHDTTQNDRI